MFSLVTVVSRAIYLSPENLFHPDGVTYIVVQLRMRSDDLKLAGNVVKFSKPPYRRVLAGHGAAALKLATNKMNVRNPHWSIPENAEGWVCVSLKKANELDDSESESEV